VRNLKDRRGRRVKFHLVLSLFLVLVGVMALAFHGIGFKANLTTTNVTTANVEPLHLARENQYRIPLPPGFGEIALAGGVLLLMINKPR